MEIEEVAAKTPGEDPQGGRRSRRRPGRLPGAQPRLRPGPARRGRQERRRAVLLRSTARSSTPTLAGGDQPAGGHSPTGRCWRSTPRSPSTTTPSTATRTWRRLRDLDEEDPAEIEAKSTTSLHQARRQHRLHGQRRRPGHGHHGHHQALRRRAGQLPRRGRRRHQGAGHRGVQDHLSDPSGKGIFVNIFGGIMKCDVIADGVVAAAKEVGLTVPLVVRLEGTNVERARRSWPSGLSHHHGRRTWPTAREKIVDAVRLGGQSSHGNSRRTRDTEVIVQGIHRRGRHLPRQADARLRHRRSSAASRPARAARDHEGFPVFDTVADAVKKTGANATVIFVPPPGAADAILEAAQARASSWSSASPRGSRCWTWSRSSARSTRQERAA